MRLTIASCEHRNNSRLGNSRWLITFTDGSSYLTQTDGSIGVMLSENWAGRTVDVEFAKHRIRHMTEVK